MNTLITEILTVTLILSVLVVIGVLAFHPWIALPVAKVMVNVAAMVFVINIPCLILSSGWKG